MVANFRALNRIPFTRERFNHIRAFLIDGTMPPHITSSNGRSKFRRRARAFALTRDRSGLVYPDRHHVPPRVLAVVPDDNVRADQVVTEDGVCVKDRQPDLAGGKVLLAQLLVEEEQVVPHTVQRLLHHRRVLLLAVQLHRAQRV